MRAVLIEGSAGIDSVRVGEVSEPEPLGGELVVRVRAAGLNRSDLLQARGMYPAPAGVPESIPGLEFAGEVVALGRGCTGDVKSGDRVMGIVGGGGLAEFAAIHERMALRVTNELSWEEAASIPEAFITAHDALITRGCLQPGESVLVHAAGGGVGLAAVQVANAMGCRVVGSSRTREKLERAREYGLESGVVLAGDLDEVARQVRAAAGGDGVAVVCDMLGGPYWAMNVACLRPLGTLVLVGLLAGRHAHVDLRMLMDRRIRVVGTVLRARAIEQKIEATRGFAETVLPWIERGRVRPVLDSVYPLWAIRAAMARMESNESFGKVVVRMG